MTVTKTDIKLLIPFVVITVIGLSNLLSYTFLQESTELTFKWFILPSVLGSAIYSYYLVFQRGPKQAVWKKWLALVGIFGMMTLIFLKSFHGFVLLANSETGSQIETVTKGIVTRLDYPQRKKLFSSYTIEIKGSKTDEKIRLNVPTGTYVLGQEFEQKLKRGSLNILYQR